MGYEIEKSGFVVRKPKDKDDWEDSFFAFHFLASNNVVPRDFEPNYFAHGWEYKIIGAACRMAAEANSGMLKPNNMDMEPEKYIGLWRNRLNRAISWEKFVEIYPFREFRIYISKENLKRIPKLKDWEKERMKKLKDMECTPCDWAYDDKPVDIFHVPIDKYEDIKLAVGIKGIAKENKMLYCWGLELGR